MLKFESNFAIDSNAIKYGRCFRDVASPFTPAPKVTQTSRGEHQSYIDYSLTKLGSFVIFRGSGPVLLRNSMFI